MKICLLFNLPLPLAGEGRGEAEGGPLASGYDLSPSLPLCVIPYSLIYEKRCGASSSPHWGEEIKRFYFLSKKI
jgi:hypothetical protein